jgi:hypothetical protein
VWGLAVEHCDPLETPGTAVETPVKAPVEGWQIEQRQVRWRIIRPILQAPKGTSARAGLMREAVAGRHDYPGGACQFPPGITVALSGVHARALLRLDGVFSGLTRR